MDKSKMIAEIEKYVQAELLDFLGYEVGSSELGGIIDNILEDANERINEFIEITEEDGY